MRKNKPVRDPGSITYSAAIESAATSDTPAPTGPTSPSVYCAKQTRRGFTEGFSLRGAGAMALPGSGTHRPGNCFPKPLRFSIGFHAQGSFAPKPVNPSSAQPAKAQAWAAERCSELDAGKLHAVVHALRAHAASSPEATKMARALHLPQFAFACATRSFQAQGFCTSTGVLEAWLQSGDREPGSSGAPACTGAFRARMQSSRCAARSSADAMKTFGSVRRDKFAA